MAGRRIASLQRSKEITDLSGWFILTFPDDKTNSGKPGSRLQSTRSKIICETNPTTFIALFGVAPVILLLIIGCITWKTQFRLNKPVYDDAERRRLLSSITPQNRYVHGQVR